MFRFLLVNCYLALGFSLWSQGETNRWYFGNNAGLDFSTSPPSPISNSSISATYGCSSICDGAGNLLFYTDGTTIRNSNQTVMPNGSGLLGNNGAQSCIIVKKPGSLSLYYVFTVQGGGGSAGLNYSIVDMGLAAGTGSVTVLNSPLYPFACEEKICAVKHCNQTDVWVMVHQAYSDNFIAYLLTSSGITSSVVTSIGSTHTSPSTKGSMKFSPNGHKLISIYTNQNQNGGVTYAIPELFDFDPSTGVLSNYIWFYSYAAPLGNAWHYGCEFSPDGTKVYMCNVGQVLQYNLCAGPATLWGITPDVIENNPALSNNASLQLGHDGKIYVACPGLQSLGVIDYPNLAGPACSFSLNALPLGTGTCQYGLPTFVSSFFENPTLNSFSYTPSAPLCSTTSFSAPSFTCGAEAGYTVSTWQWNFGDPASGANNVASSADPTHNFSSTGTYTVQLIQTYVCGISKTFTQAVSVVIGPTLSVSASSPSACVGNPITLVAQASGGVPVYSFIWNNTIQNPSLTVNPPVPGVYSYTVVLTDNAVCQRSTSINLSFYTLPSLALTANPVCAQTTTTLYASGAAAYTWQPWSAQNSSLVITPAATTNYTLTGMNSAGCTSSLSGVLVVNPLPIIGLATTQSFCSGQPIALSAGGQNLLWTGPGNFSSTAASPTVNLSGLYSVVVTDANSCTASSTTSITVNANPTLSISGNSTICAGQSAVLGVSGANSYSWSNGSAGASFTVSPAGTSSYTVTGTDLNGCSASASVNVVVSRCTGIAEWAEQAQVLIYPNPFDQRLFIKSESAVELDLYDAGGRLLRTFSAPPGDHELPMGDLAPGVYHVRLRSVNGQQVVKLVKTAE